jgi:hypothetical protein
MSYYYKYNFVSPEPVYSTVKEELKSYFDTGAVDDLMFPTYLDKCLRKLGRSSYVIAEVILEIRDFEARLPDNFFAVREAWRCSALPVDNQDSGSFYSQATLTENIQVRPLDVGGDPCSSPGCTDPNCNGTCTVIEQTIYKSTVSSSVNFKREYLLKPGSISAHRNCTVDYTEAWSFTNEAQNREFTPGSSSYDSFDIRDNKFVTNFRDGVVHLLMYVTEYDNIGNQMIPDNYRVREFVEAFIKYKVFEVLSNQINDETFNQIQQKMLYYKQLHDEAFIMADIEIKKQDAWTKQRRIKNDLNRFNMYELPNRTNRFGRRNN